jgi:hypothetical protein
MNTEFWVNALIALNALLPILAFLRSRDYHRSMLFWQCRLPPADG